MHHTNETLPGIDCCCTATKPSPALTLGAVNGAKAPALTLYFTTSYGWDCGSNTALGVKAILDLNLACDLQIASPETSYVIEIKQKKVGREAAVTG